MHDVVIIGAGHNGLTAAAFLAKAGLKVLVLERAERVGGAAITTELAPGYRVPTLAHAASIDPAIVRALDLHRHGLEILRPDVAACAPTLDGRSLVLWADPARASGSIAAFSRRDAERYPAFVAAFARIAGVLRAVHGAPPPSIDAPSGADLLELLKTGRAFRALGRPDAYRLLRWMPMAVADLVGEWFESEPLRATVAGGGVLGSFLGPWSAGSGAALMLLGAAEGHPVGTGWFARGGTGAVTQALAAAATAAGATIRTGTSVREIVVSDGAATGVALDSGETIAARAVASSADPRRTLVGLIDPVHLSPDFVRRVRNIRMRGALAKVNFAVSSLPRFSGLPAPGADEQRALSGRVRLARDVNAIERAFDAAKYGSVADEPWIELTIPSVLDPSLAPRGSHVVSAYVQFAPYDLRGTSWDSERDRLGDTTARTIAQYAPGFGASIVACQVLTPLDLERDYGLTGGQIFHGELALDQFYVARPLLGWSRYRTPIENLFLCGSGTHPGTGLTGRSGALAAKEVSRSLK
ncbi:MAG: phytoene desaturase family protein [Betaproteobacteria bacterium]